MTRKKVLKLRRECFGGTIFDITSGRRAYVDRTEFERIKCHRGLDAHLMAELGMNGSIDVTTPAWIPDFNFSAPDTVFFEVTRACNLRCSHCLNASGVRSMDELTQKQRLSMIDDLAETGVQEIRFTGGEPMILDGLGELLARATALNLRTSMGTNAVLATEKNVHRFARFLHMAIVSIDGMEDRHDSIRGRGAFRRTMAGMENFLSYSIKVRVNTVIMRSGIHDTVALAEHLYNRGIPLFVRRLVPSGRATDMLSEVLNKEEYEQVCVQLKPYLADPRGLTQGHYLNERALETRIRLPFRRSSCSAGHRGMVTLPNGNMQTCGFLGSLGEPSVGKVPDESLATIWKRLLVSNHIASLEDNLAIHNQYSTGPSTNCLAIALSSRICTPP